MSPRRPGPKPPKHACPTCGLLHRTPHETDELTRIWDYCAECGKKCTEDYQLEDAVWLLTGLPLGPEGGVLHLECVAKRIKRNLTREDFADRPVNALVFAVLDLVS